MRFFWLLFLLPFSLFAATQDSVSVSSVFTDLKDLRLNASEYEFPLTKQQDYQLGYIEAIDALQMELSSNTSWDLKIKTNDAHMGSLSNRDKPISDLLWKTTTGSYQALSSQDVLISSHNSGCKRMPINLSFKVLLDWGLDGPGNYQVDLILTLANQGGN